MSQPTKKSELTTLSIPKTSHAKLHSAVCLLPRYNMQTAGAEAIDDWVNKLQPEIQTAIKALSRTHSKRSNH